MDVLDRHVVKAVTALDKKFNGGEFSSESLARVGIRLGGYCLAISFLLLFLWFFFSSVLLGLSAQFFGYFGVYLLVLGIFTRLSTSPELLRADIVIAETLVFRLASIILFIALGIFTVVNSWLSLGILHAPVSLAQSPMGAQLHGLMMLFLISVSVLALIYYFKWLKLLKAKSRELFMEYAEHCWNELDRARRGNNEILVVLDVFERKRNGTNVGVRDEATGKVRSKQIRDFPEDFDKGATIAINGASMFVAGVTKQQQSVLGGW